MGDHRDPDRDQALPIVSDGPLIHHLVMDDVKERMEYGTRKYGHPLQAHNGRNSLRDAYEEALDLAIYLRAALEEQK